MKKSITVIGIESDGVRGIRLEQNGVEWAVADREFWEFGGDGEAVATVEPFIGKEYKEGDFFCYIMAPWGEFVEVPAALGGKLVEINAKQGTKLNKGEVIAYIERSQEDK